MINVEQTIISQYGNSATISKLVHNIDLYLDPRADLDTFYDYVWNVETAQGFGLDIWGRIVGVSREIFTNPVYYLEDNAYRSLILLKALSNISIASSPSINNLLKNWMAGRGKCYVSDLGNMQMRYNFEFLLEPFEIQIITNSGIFLRPAGVDATIISTEFPVFGFKQMGTTWAVPFNQAPFRSGIHAVK
jgi:hypothetical protein